jgi:hypothetical protein
LAPTAAATPRVGLIRIALAVAVPVAWSWASSEVIGGVYLAAGLALAFGALSAAGRPQTFLRDRFLHVVVDSALVGLLVACTGGGRSPFFSLFFLAALGIISIEARARIVAATIAVAGGYLAAAVLTAGPGVFGPGTISKVGFLTLFCAVVGFLGYGMQGTRRLVLKLSSTLANEIDRVGKAESLISKFGPVLKVLSREETLRWAAEAAHTVGGGAYAHVATLNGSHDTILQGDFDVCPGWWPPRSSVSCCRAAAKVRPCAARRRSSVSRDLWRSP